MIGTNERTKIRGEGESLFSRFIKIVRERGLCECSRAKREGIELHNDPYSGSGTVIIIY